MSIAFDAISSANPTTFTVGLGNNAILLLLTGDSPNGSPPASMTYNGVAMTLGPSLNGPGSGSGSPGLHVFYLLNPPQGSSHSFGGTVTPQWAVSYLGVSSIFPSYQSAQGEGPGSIPLAITPDTGGSWVVAVAMNGSNPPTFSPATQRGVFSTTNAWADSNSAPGSLYTVTFGTGNLQFYSFALFLLTPHVDNTLVGATGMLTLTGINAVLTKGTAHFLVGATGLLSLTGKNATLTRFRKWINQVKDASTFTNKSKSMTPTYTNKTKDSSTWTNQNKH